MEEKLYFFQISLGCMRKERFCGGRRRDEYCLGEERAMGTGSIHMRPTSTLHTIRPVLHFANLYPGCWFSVSLKKKERKEKRKGFFCLVFKCLLS